MLREKIIEAKTKVGMSNYRLSILTGLQKTQIANYLSGKNDLTGENIDKILITLNLHFSN